MGRNAAWNPGEFGFSDIAPMDSVTFVVVFDTKGFEDAPRLGLLTLNEDGVESLIGFEGVDWKDPRERASDLESLCAVPARPGEYLVLESGSWEGRPGRVFHLKVSKKEARVLGAADIPILAPNAPGQTGDQYEGLACTAAEETDILLVLGERGGSDPFPSGVLRWGRFDLETHAFRWSPGGSRGRSVRAPGRWPESGNRRDITGLFLDREDRLWASAALDGGDEGPFRSVVFMVATVDASSPDPITLLPDPAVGWEVGEHKIEGMTSAPSYSGTGFRILAASEDESFGGGVRVLGPGGGT